MQRLGQKPFILGTLAAGVILLLANYSAAAEVTQGLLLDDCRKCHQQQLAEISESGRKHRDAISCVDCHQEHPPRGKSAIPECSSCHRSQTNRHFAARGCQECHPPHRPLAIDYSLSPGVRQGCLTCHPLVGEELADYPSNHTVLDCKECHQEHGNHLSCMDCHAPHLPGQKEQNCRECHRPHRPLRVAYKNNIAVASCAPCHRAVAAQLARNQTRHHDFLCVYCHKSQHKQIPTCITCHREPHFDSLHDHFANCNKCHFGPHKLLN